MGALIWPLLGVIAGAMVMIQAPINASMARGLGLPIAAAAISFAVGAIILTALTLIITGANGPALNWRAPAVWTFFAGGVLGAAFVTLNVMLAPRLGTASLAACLVTGQLLTGLLLDRIGFMGLAARELTVGRVAGAALLLAGAFLITTR